ncbi:hypothetical protein L6452_19392 [Arctium lappa]|uniref:Uncharacterized protein n=1 Tax=Arctium lappa TaxID=4217 RepID=A0ACB9BA96_ARCLA|nr:hypothetical protein L6452_19392 [Arctium lappa]
MLQELMVVTHTKSLENKLKRKFDDDEDHNLQKGEKRQRTEPSEPYVVFPDVSTQNDQMTQRDNEGLRNDYVDEVMGIADGLAICDECLVNKSTYIVLYKYEVSGQYDKRIPHIPAQIRMET